MKGKTFSLFIIVLVFGLGFLFYNSDYYENMVIKKMNVKVLPELENSLNNFYLYKNADFKDLSVHEDALIKIYLKKNSVFNPKDTKKLCDTFSQKYLESVDTLSILFHGIKKANIEYYIFERESFGPIYIFSDRNMESNFDSIKTLILKQDKKMLNELHKKRVQEQKHKRELILSKKAFGEVLFGDSKENTLKKLKEDPRVKFSNVMVDNPTFKVWLGSYQYRLSPIFNEDKIILINIVSDGYKKNQYKSMVYKTWENLMIFYSEIYGISPGNLPDKNKIEPGFIEWTNEWNVASKKIQVGISLNNERYYVVAWITNENFKLEQ